MAGNYYKLDGKVAVGIDMGSDGTKTGGASATLTIEPGVTVFGESGNDYLVVTRGSKINAVGTSSAPIIMTGRQDILGEADIVNTRGLGRISLLGKSLLINAHSQHQVLHQQLEQELTLVKKTLKDPLEILWVVKFQLIVAEL